jgi:hypothetical protein
VTLLIILVQHIAGVEPSGHEFSQSTAHHVVAASRTVPDVALVLLGAIVVVMTTIYTVWFLIRPGESGDRHIKRRILDDRHEGSR